MKSSTQELVVVKDNELIENFIFNATELELQILNYAVAVTNPYWEGSDHIYRISIPELVATYKTKSKNAYKVYREALERLQIRTYRYNNGVKEVTENVLRKIIRDTTDNTYLEVCFNNYIATRLNNLKGLFTQYNIKNIAMFSSRYAFMLYEFFKMKLSCSGEKKYTSQPEIHEFKSNLDIAGKYKQTSDLKKIVIEPAKRQINRYSDIRIDYEIIKIGRTPTYIKFTAKYKKAEKPLDKSTSKILPQMKTNKTNLSIPESNVINKEAGFTSDHKAVGKQRLKELRKKLNIQK